MNLRQERRILLGKIEFDNIKVKSKYTDQWQGKEEVFFSKEGT